MTCTHCGFRPRPDTHPHHRRPMCTVVDDVGSAPVCALCVVAILGRVDGLDATLMLSRPTGVPVSRG